MTGTEICADSKLQNYEVCQGLNAYAEQTAISTVGNVLSTVYGVVGILAVIVIIISGIQYMTSQGAPDKIAKAKKTLSGSVIGLVICLSAFGITQFILKGLGADDSSTDTTTTTTNTVKTDGSEVLYIAATSHTSVEIGYPAAVNAVAIPNTATNRTLSYTSSDPKIFTVDKSGNLTGVSEGNATLTIAAASGLEKTVNIEVKKPIEVESITLSVNKNNALETLTSTSLKKSAKLQIVATVLPKNAKDKRLTWTSSDSSHVSVDSKGLVKAIKSTDKDVTITATASNGVSASATIQVAADLASVGVTDSLIQHMDAAYHQTNFNHTISCKADGGTIASSGCGLSTYLAAHYALTRQDVDYVSFADGDACNSGFVQRTGGSDYNVVFNSQRTFFENKYGITLQSINGQDINAYVAALKRGHVVNLMVTGPGGFRSNTQGNHYILALSYRENNGGEIYVWNPNGINQGWVSLSFFQTYGIGHYAGHAYEISKK